MSQTKAQLLDGKSATIQFTGGSASAPAVSFTGDTNTGIYSPGADQVAISTNSTGRLFIDSSGNVGIGSAPSAVTLGGLDIRSGGLGLVVGADSAASTRTDATTKLGRYLSPHYLNAEEPVAALIASNDSTESIVSVGGGTGLANAATTVRFFTAANNTTTSGTERLRITSDGKVGVGTSSPTGNLHVNSGGNTELLVSSSFAGSPETAIRIDTVGDASRANVYFSKSGTNRGSIQYHHNAAGASERLQLTPAGSTGLNVLGSGNVGIGTTSPVTKHHVSMGSDSAIIGYFQGTSAAVRIGSSASPVYGTVQGVDATNGTTSYQPLFLTGSSVLLGASGNEHARIDSSGRLLVGTSSARTNLYNSNVSAQIQVEGIGFQNAAISSIATGSVNSYDSGSLILGKGRGGAIGANTVVQNNDILGYISFQGNDGTEFVEGGSIKTEVDGTPGANDMPGRLVFSTTKDGQSSPTQALIIESGQQSLFTTSTSARSTTGWYGVQADATVGAINISRNGSNVMAFFHTSNANGVSGSPVGTISITTTATAYNTSSDYRLKENVTPVTDGITRLQQLKPSRFNFIADPAKTVDGFLAHEAAEVVPECVTGEKDAVDDDGNSIYQGIDQSKLVPLLTAALQEAVAKIEGLEARLTAAGI